MPVHITDDSLSRWRSGSGKCLEDGVLTPVPTDSAGAHGARITSGPSRGPRNAHLVAAPLVSHDSPGFRDSNPMTGAPADDRR